jgi:hypothetical protein
MQIKYLKLESADYLADYTLVISLNRKVKTLEAKVQTELPLVVHSLQVRVRKKKLNF